ncbi:hypothetical protein SUGI_0498850 [Cryptomeria japonica]|nr:hypothetical protein SUGI_0498850 [Cryptomeria japonica]
MVADETDGFVLGQPNLNTKVTQNDRIIGKHHKLIDDKNIDVQNFALEKTPENVDVEVQIATMKVAGLMACTLDFKHLDEGLDGERNNRKRSSKEDQKSHEIPMKIEQPLAK